MKKALIILALLFPFLSTAQNKIEEIFKDQGEVFFSFELQDLSQLESYNQIISLDHNMEVPTIYAYANKKQFADFLDRDIDFKILPKPGDRINAKMITKAEWEALKSIDCNHSWDAYPTYDLYETLMEEFAMNYPDICVLEEIGTLPSGRKLLTLKITDNVNIEEAEPKFFYTSSMHGDETAGYILLLRYIEYLLCNYGSDAHLTELVNEIEIWINPLANPDGTYTNNDNTVNGATRSNANFIDLNRNYPDPEAGPNPDGESTQPETAAFIAFHESHHFDMSCNMHGGAEVVNYPWDTWAVQCADHHWWEHVSNEYADTCQANSPNDYFDDFGTGVTNGYEWYSINGGRQDYVCFFEHGREMTLELSDQKLLDENELLEHWEYNFPSLINYMEQSLFGVRGIVTDSLTTEPLVAEVFISGHDVDNSQVYSRLPHGNYHRYLKEDSYDLTFSADGYISKTIRVYIVENAIQYVDVQLAKVLEVDVNKIVSSSLLSIFPNPTQSILHFSMQTNGAQKMGIQLFDIVGRVVMQKEFLCDQAILNGQLDLSKLQSGTYIVELSTSESSVYRKISVY